MLSIINEPFYGDFNTISNYIIQEVENIFGVIIKKTNLLYEENTCFQS